MSITDEKAGRQGASRFVWINAPVFVCLLACALVLFTLRQYSIFYYDAAKDEAIAEAQDTIRRVVLDISQTFYSYDSILKSAIAVLEDEAIATLAPDVQDRLLARMVVQFPYVRSIVVLTPSGTVRNSSISGTPAQDDYGGSDFFREQVSGALVGPYMALFSREGLKGLEYQVAISRRITYAGQFRGVAVVFVRLRDFRDQFTNINIGGGNTLVLVHDSGQILTRKPSRDGLGDFGTAVSPSKLARLQRTSEGSYFDVSRLDGRQRLFVFQRVPEWPLMLVVGTPVDAIDAEWRQRIAIAGSASALSCFALAVLGFRLRRERIKRAEAEAALEQLSVTDFLTGLANRRRFDEVVQREFRRAVRTDGWLSVVSIDADHFKALNDRFGHSAGDETLKMIAAAISSCARRASDLGARLGGEEFAIVLPDTSAAAAYELTERIRRTMEAHAFNPDGPPATTLSAGIASTKDRPAPESVRALIEAADQALYRAKNAGRNRTELAASLTVSAA